MTQYLAFDIGGTNLKYALLDKKGKIIEKGSTPTKTEKLIPRRKLFILVGPYHFWMA